MTVQELIAQLQKFPPHDEVEIDLFYEGTFPIDSMMVYVGGKVAIRPES